jgi:hypothetical protein
MFEEYEVASLLRSTSVQFSTALIDPKRDCCIGKHLILISSCRLWIFFYAYCSVYQWIGSIEGNQTNEYRWENNDKLP